MTCIVGWIDNGTVWMGADSAGVAGYSLTVRADKKVFRNGPMVFGFAGSFRAGDLLKHSLAIPDHDPRVDDAKYMATTFINAVRQCFKDGGFATKEKDQEHGGWFLVGYKGRLYTIYSDYQVGEPTSRYHAMGCGDDVAHGAMFACETVGDLSARDRIELALRAAEAWSAGVRSPFHIESLEPTAKGA